MPRLKIQGSADKIRIYEAYLQFSFIYSIKCLFSASYVLCSGSAIMNTAFLLTYFLKNNSIRRLSITGKIQIRYINFRQSKSIIKEMGKGLYRLRQNEDL